MDYYTHHSRSAAATQTRLGDTCPVITWSNKNYPIIPGSATRRKDLATGGFQLNADFRFEALVSSFLSATIPDAETLHSALLQTFIGYLGDEYKVIAVLVHAGGQQIAVECNSASQGS